MHLVVYTNAKNQVCFTVCLAHATILAVIAAVHGDCIGGGIDLITACDIRLCTTDAKFCVKETKVAIVADLGTTHYTLAACLPVAGTLQRLPKIIGRGPAREMCLTGDVVDAPRAKSFNLVNEVGI